MVDEATNSDVDENGRKSVFNSRPGTTTKKNSGTISILQVNSSGRDWIYVPFKLIFQFGWIAYDPNFEFILITASYLCIVLVAWFILRILRLNNLSKKIYTK